MEWKWTDLTATLSCSFWPKTKLLLLELLEAGMEKGFAEDSDGRLARGSVADVADVVDVISAAFSALRLHKKKIEKIR